MQAEAEIGPTKDAKGREISVVIPVYNNRDTLRACLQAISRSSVTPLEVILVDDGSTDGSREIMEEYPYRILVLSKNMGVGYAREKGASATSGKFVFFTDGDVEISRNTLELGYDELAGDSGISAVIGLYAPDCGGGNFVSDFKNLSYHYVHMNSADESSVFVGNCGMIRKDAFLAIGGFSDGGVYPRILEDVSLGMRLVKSGHRIRLHKGMQIRHNKRYGYMSLWHSDLFGRAIPWTKLILRHQLLKNDNCTDIRAFLLVLAAWLIPMLGLVGLAIDPWFLILMPAVLVTEVAGDTGFYLFLLRRRGLGFALKSSIMRNVYHLIGGAGLMAGAASYAGGRFADFLSRTPDRDAASPIYDQPLPARPETMGKGILEESNQ